MMKIPVVRHFNPEDVIGEFDSETMSIEFFNPENLIFQVLALGYSIDATMRPEMHEETTKVTIKAISLVFKKEVLIRGQEL